MTQVNADKQEEITDDICEALGKMPGLIEVGGAEDTSFSIRYQSRGTVVEATVEVTDINVYFGEV